MQGFFLQARTKTKIVLAATLCRFCMDNYCGQTVLRRTAKIQEAHNDSLRKGFDPANFMQQLFLG